MKQRHSFHELWYHIVMHVKDRHQLILNEEMGRTLGGYLISKAPDVDAYIEEIGFWRDHVHLLLRCGVARPLSEVYGQLKGFSWAAWKKRFPENPFRWGDGVYISTVTPDNTAALREYIRNQWERHETRAIVDEWEHAETT